MSDISSIGLSQSGNAALGSCTDVKTAINVKMMKASQESAKVAGSIIEDTVSVSKEAMNALNAEKAGK